jgi:hypothetical protein
MTGLAGFLTVPPQVRPPQSYLGYLAKQAPAQALPQLNANP